MALLRATIVGILVLLVATSGCMDRAPACDSCSDGKSDGKLGDATPDESSPCGLECQELPADDGPRPLLASIQTQGCLATYAVATTGEEELQQHIPSTYDVRAAWASGLAAVQALMVDCEAAVVNNTTVIEAFSMAVVSARVDAPKAVAHGQDYYVLEWFASDELVVEALRKLGYPAYMGAVEIITTATEQKGTLLNGTSPYVSVQKQGYHTGYTQTPINQVQRLHYQPEGEALFVDEAYERRLPDPLRYELQVSEFHGGLMGHLSVTATVPDIGPSLLHDSLFGFGR